MKKSNKLTLFVETPNQEIKEMTLNATNGTMTRTFEDDSYDVSCHTRRNKKNALRDSDGRLWVIISFSWNVDSDGNQTYKISGEKYEYGRYSYHNWDIQDLFTVLAHRYDGEDYLGRTCDESGFKTGENIPLQLGGK